MSLIDVAEERIRQGVADIFTMKQYPVFLAFAANFLSFSFKNIVMMYLQAPDARFVAGMYAWKQMTDANVSLDKIPVLVLYPEYNPETKSFAYSIRKVFDYAQLGGNSPQVLNDYAKKCDSSGLYGCFTDTFKTEKKKSVYLSVDEVVRDIEQNEKAVIVPKSIPDKEKFKMLLDVYLSSTANDSSQVINGCISNTIKYLIYSYYGMDEVKRITFPYISLPEVDDDDARARILCMAFNVAKGVTESVDSNHLTRIREREEEER